MEETSGELVGKNLRVLLALHQISITKLYKETGIARSTIYNITTGKAKGIQLETLKKICEFFGIEPNDLFL